MKGIRHKISSVWIRRINIIEMTIVPTGSNQSVADSA
jgi:hypothetical protein